MPSTAHGVPYPASSDPPNVPADLQKIADVLDSYIPLRVRKTGTTYVTNNTTPQNDPDLKITLPYGTFQITALIIPASTNLAGADLRVAWAFSGTTSSTPSRTCHGPGIATADATGGAANANRASAHNLTTAVAYGADGTTSSAIVEQFVMNVTSTGAGVLTLQWAQNTANATANSTGLTGASNFIVQKIFQTN